MTCSREQRRRKLKRKPGVQSSKAHKRFEQKLAAERSKRLKARPKPEPEPEKPGRNDPCPCGSEKKYKVCCYLGPYAAKCIQGLFRKEKESPPLSEIRRSAKRRK